MNFEGEVIEADDSASLSPHQLLWRILQDAEEGDDNSTELSLVDDDGSPLWFVGVFLYAFGAFSLALGVVLQKLSINRELDRAHVLGVEMRPKYKQKIWVLGIVMYGASGGLLSAALAFAPQSLLTPLMSIVMISNALLARFLLNEPLTKRDFGCVALNVISVVFTTASAPTNNTTRTTEQLLKLFEAPYFIGFIVSLLSLMLFLWIVNRMLKKKRKQKGVKLTKKEEFMFSFTFAASAGCWGGLCVTMINAAITIIKDKAEDNFFLIFKEYIVYILLAVLVTCWYQQLNWINKGLELFPAVFIVSIESVLNEIVAVSGGLLYFQEYRRFDATTGAIFGVGMLMGLGGVIAFALRDNDVTAKDDFFTNSKCFSCCKCCFLKDIEDKDDRPQTRSVGRLEVHGETVFIDEEGNEIDPDKKEIVYEHIDTPITLLADAAKNFADHIAFQEEVNEQTGKTEKKARWSVKRAVSKTSKAIRQSLRRGGMTSPFPNANSRPASADGNKSIVSKSSKKEHLEEGGRIPDEFEAEPSSNPPEEPVTQDTRPPTL